MAATASSASPPKAGMPPQQPASVPLDYSFMGLSSLSAMSTQHASTGAAKSPKKKHAPVSLRVNNNKIFHLDDMHEALSAVFDHPEMLQWLDLSGNELTTIPAEAFSPYPDLFTLNLHGNQLSKYSDIDALARWLPRLHSISLHGNPLEERKHYRNYVIASFPNLKQLNFSSVTIGDRDKADTWAKIYKNTRASGGKGHREDDL